MRETLGISLMRFSNNSADPRKSTWTHTTSYSHSSIYCFYNENLTSVNNRTNTFLNDAVRNTDDAYLNYRGDICQYLSKTGAVSDNWRMPTSQEFGEASQYTMPGNYKKITTDNNGTTIINSYVYFTNGAAYFPASGYRDVNGTLGSNVGESGYYWCSSPYNVSKEAIHFGFYSGGILPATHNDRQLGFPIRAILK